ESFSSCWSLSPQESRVRPAHAPDQSKVFSARFHRRRDGSHSSLGQWPQHLCRRKSLRESAPTQRLLQFRLALGLVRIQQPRLSLLQTRNKQERTLLPGLLPLPSPNLVVTYIP